MSDKKEQPAGKVDANPNADWQGVDKDPLEEQGRAEKVTKEDLKGKKVDAYPEAEKKNA